MEALGFEVSADAVCVACGHGVRRGERFVSPAPDKPFHRACFACLRCNVTIPSTTEFNFCASTNRLLCKPCHETLLPAPTATPLDPLSIHCQSCSVKLKHACVARGIDGEMGLWCTRCAACRNCRLPFAETDLTLQVLDELYCTRCSDAARLRLYNISRFGAGLIQPVPVRSNLPAVSAYTDARGYSIFNFKHPSARTQLSNK